MSQTQTITARILAAHLTRLLGQTVSPKQVRGRVRGDSGAALLDRYSPESKPAYAAHAYTLAEANRIGTAIVDSHNRRVAPDKAVKYVPFGQPVRKPSARKPSARKPATVKAQQPATAPQTAADGPSASN